MEHKTYQAFKALHQKEAKGTATFQERMLLKIMLKRHKQGKEVHLPAPQYPLPGPR
jgi:hypothetical protein